MACTKCGKKTKTATTKNGKIAMPKKGSNKRRIQLSDGSYIVV